MSPCDVAHIWKSDRKHNRPAIGPKETTNKEYIEELFHIDPTLNHDIGHKDNTCSMVEQGRLVQRGECLIINQIFKDNPQFYRQGTEQDEESLIRIWNMIGCRNNISIVRDLTKKQIITALNKFRQQLEKTGAEHSLTSTPCEAVNLT